jgi:hypothetical protein
MGYAAASLRSQSSSAWAFSYGGRTARSGIAEICRRLDLVQAGRYNQAACERTVVDEESFCREKKNEADLAAPWR